MRKEVKFQKSLFSFKETVTFREKKSIFEFMSRIVTDDFLTWQTIRGDERGSIAPIGRSQLGVSGGKLGFQGLAALGPTLILKEEG